jgi:hypothetical protein
MIRRGTEEDSTVHLNVQKNSISDISARLCDLLRIADTIGDKVMDTKDTMIIVGVIFVVTIALWYLFTHEPPNFAYTI